MRGWALVSVFTLLARSAARIESRHPCRCTWAHARMTAQACWRSWEQQWSSAACGISIHCLRLSAPGVAGPELRLSPRGTGPNEQARPKETRQQRQRVRTREPQRPPPHSRCHRACCPRLQTCACGRQQGAEWMGASCSAQRTRADYCPRPAPPARSLTSSSPLAWTAAVISFVPRTLTGPRHLSPSQQREPSGPRSCAASSTGLRPEEAQENQSRSSRRMRRRPSSACRETSELAPPQRRSRRRVHVTVWQRGKQPDRRG